MPNTIPEGLSATMGRDTIYIVLPRLASEKQLLSAVWNLRQLYQQDPPVTDWVIDLSKLDDLPLSLLGVLLAINKDLRSGGQRLRLTGFPSHLADVVPLQRLSRAGGQTQRRAAPESPATAGAVAAESA